MLDHYITSSFEDTDPRLTDPAALQAVMAEIAQKNATASGQVLTDVVIDRVLGPDDEEARSLFERIPKGRKLVQAAVHLQSPADDAPRSPDGGVWVRPAPPTPLPAPPAIHVVHGPDAWVVIPAVLGWSNGADGTEGGENLQLYGLDNGPSPRWEKPGGRIVERSIRELGGSHEGDRYLVVRVGNRFVPDQVLQRIAEVAAETVTAITEGRHALTVVTREVTDDEADVLMVAVRDLVTRTIAAFDGEEPPAPDVPETVTTVEEATAALLAAQRAASDAAQAHGHALEVAQRRLVELRGELDG